MLAELANCANNNTGNFVELIQTGLRRARLTMRRRRNRVATVECATFPPYSPDLNPIENVWVMLNNRLEATKPTGWEREKAFKRRVRNTVAWLNSTRSGALKRMVSSMRAGSISSSRRRGKTSGGAGERGRCRCPVCIIARNKLDDLTRQMGRCRSVPTCVEKSRGGTVDEGSIGRPVGGRGPGTMLVA